MDCDPGHDDAIAILFAAQHCDILGITTVSGNVPLERTQFNARITAQILGLDLPIYAGADRPLLIEPLHAEFIHGESGLAGPKLPELCYSLEEQHAVDFIVETLRAHPDCYLVPTGPLTNIALALRKAPDIAQRVRAISLMGGGVGFGNVTSTAEFNIYADPEAADIVFRSGARLLMCGLNLTHQYMFYPADIAKVRAIGNRAAQFTADLLDFFSDMYAKRFFGRKEGPLHDPCAVMAISHPELFGFEARHVAIELTGQHTRGMTVVDERGLEVAAPVNCQVAYSLDRDAAVALMLETIAAYAH